MGPPAACAGVGQPCPQLGVATGGSLRSFQPKPFYGSMTKAKKKKNILIFLGLISAVLQLLQLEGMSMIILS